MSSQRLLMFNWAQLREGINRVCYNVNAGALRDRLWELRRVWLKFAIQKRFDNYHIPCDKQITRIHFGIILLHFPIN